MQKTPINMLDSNNNSTKSKARKYSEILAEGLKYIDDRRKGKITSFKTPWPSINAASINGLEWGTLLTIGARPGSGKTMCATQFLKEARSLNPVMDFNILEFQFEMGAKQIASRAFAAEIGLDYNVVLSAFNPLEQFSYDLMVRHTNDNILLEKQGIRRNIISTPMGHQEIEQEVHKNYQNLGEKPLVVTIDHSWLIKKNASEKEKLQTLYNTVEMLMQLKNDLPIIVVMISQLNRSIDEPARKAPGIIGNYPNSSDIFGGDALMQGSDMVVALNRPFINDVPIYGPNGYVMKTDDIALHILKSRNNANDQNLVFLKAQFNRGRMIEGPPPPSSSVTPRNYQMRSTRNNAANLSAEIGNDID